MATLAQLFVYGKVLAPEAFGVFGLVQGTYLLTQGVQRSVVVLPMIMTAHDSGGDPAWARLNAMLLAGIAAVLALLALAGGILGIDVAFRTAFALAAPCTLATLSYEFGRRTLFLQQRPRAVLAAAATYFLSTAAGVSAVAIWLRNVEAAAAALFLAAGAAWAVAWRLRAPAPLGSVRVRDHSGMIGWNLLSFLPYTVYNNGMILIVGALADVRAVALFAASRLFTAPIQTLIQAIDSVDKPRARRMYATEGLAGLSRSLNRTRRTLLALGAPYLVVILLGAGVLAPWLFGDRYPGMVNAVRMWAAVSLLMLLGQPLETGLLVLRKSNLFFWTRSLAAIAAIAALLSLRGTLPQVAPIAALAAGWGAGGALAWILLRSRLQAHPDTILRES
jgi:O-antigen/teichoic acid export membrane protein